MKSKVRKSFRNFILSRIGKSHKDSEFLDAKIISNQENEFVLAHKFVLAGLSPLLREALQGCTEDQEALIIIPDIDSKALRDFVLLSYGLLDSSEVIETERQLQILEICQLLGMCQSILLPSTNNLEEEVTTEDVERLLNAVVVEQQHSFEKEQQQQQQPPLPPRIEINPTINQLILNCNECNQKFGDEKDLAFHQQAHHQRSLTFFCGICRKPFDKETSLRHHKIAAHHAGTKVKLNCDKCGGKFTGKSALSRHVAHCDGKNSLDCHICGKVYARKDNLVNHLARHAGVQLKCEHCHKGFRTANDLYKHKKRLHAEASGLKSAYVVNCEQCGRKFTDKGRAYKDHLDYHAGIKNYECHYCSKKFATASSLRDHAGQHSGLATHACKICRKEFKRVQNIRQHLMWTHKLNSEESVRSNIEKLFLSGVDKLRALKEFEDATRNVNEEGDEGAGRE